MAAVRRRRGGKSPDAPDQVAAGNRTELIRNGSGGTAICPASLRRTLREVFLLTLFRRVAATFALVGWLFTVGPAAAQAEPENPAGAIPETSISESSGYPFLVAAGALLAAAASGGMVFYLRRRPA
ncbi:hypothetical protein QRX50_07215 [Amycolatopsis carbonis]|uniref:LPXTG cell wall anchor domain-containing protein n=1 Tax=Amycolatopsis carbonis TaxID=715471 RepID=A0A9Y2IIT0_9PSEU|nr:hypothetical protein [Amycolatopsis sp. 2-15]WIX80552.1 hypothetical protein QRX50_07215 [Amycolatopsis sp. 2-15]